VMAAVSVVLPWSTCPMVPMLQCGLILWNTFFSDGAAYVREPTIGPTAFCFRSMSFKHLCRGTLYFCAKSKRLVTITVIYYSRYIINDNRKKVRLMPEFWILTRSVWKYLFSWAGDLFLGTGNKSKIDRAH